MAEPRAPAGPSIPITQHGAPSPGVGGCWPGSRAAGREVLCSPQSPLPATAPGWPCLWAALRTPCSAGTAGVGHLPVWVSPLWALHLLWCCASSSIAPPRCRIPGYRTVGIVPCLRGYCPSGHRISSAVRRLAVMPPWLSCLWVLCFWVSCVLGCRVMGCCASLGVFPPGMSCLGTPCRWALCFLEYRAPLCILRLSIVASRMFCLCLLHLRVLVLLGCHASRDRASSILRLWVLGLLRRHAFGCCTFGCRASLDVTPPGAVPLGTALLDTVSPRTAPLGTVPLAIVPLMVPGRAQACPVPVCLKPLCLSFPSWQVVGAGPVTPRLASLCPLPMRCWCGVRSSGGTVPGPHHSLCCRDLPGLSITRWERALCPL